MLLEILKPNLIREKNVIGYLKKELDLRKIMFLEISN